MSAPFPLVAVGVGPGDPAYLTLTAREHVAVAEVVAGFKSALDIVRDVITGECLTLDYRNQEAELMKLGAHVREGRRCVLCVYGDLNFSADELLTRAEAHCGPLTRLPGISSVQMAMARAGLAMETSLFITLHKRADLETDLAELLEAARADRRQLIVLPRPFDWMPPALARFLLDGGVPGERAALVYERLTLPGERARAFTLAALAESAAEFSDLSIFVLRRAEEPQ